MKHIEIEDYNWDDGIPKIMAAPTRAMLREFFE